MADERDELLAFYAKIANRHNYVLRGETELFKGRPNGMYLRIVFPEDSSQDESTKVYFGVIRDFSELECHRERSLACLEFMKNASECLPNMLESFENRMTGLGYEVDDKDKNLFYSLDEHNVYFEFPLGINRRDAAKRLAEGLASLLDR